MRVHVHRRRLPADFIKQLGDAANSLSATLTERKQRAAQRGTATAFLREHLSQARKIVKVLDGFVKTAAKDDPQLIVTWQILKRLRQPRESTPETIPAPSAAPSAGALTSASTGASA